MMIPRIPLIARIILGTAFAVFLGFGLARISFEVDILKLLPRDLPAVQGLLKLNTHFAQPEELILTVETGEPQQAVELAESLSAMLRQRPDLAQMVVSQPLWRERPQDLVELLSFTAINAPPAEFEQITDRLEPENARRRAAEAFEDLGWSLSPEEIARLSHDPFGLFESFTAQTHGNAPSDFGSPEGDYRLIYLKAPQGKAQYLELPGWVDAVWAAAREWRDAQQNPDSIKLGMTGEPVFIVEISRSMERDMKLSGAFTLLIVALLFFGVYRRLWPLWMMLLMLVGSFAIALGLAGYFLPHLTVLSVGFASILVGLNIDYAMITYNNWIAGSKNAQTLRREVAPGIAWAAGTTALAFFSLNISSIPGLAQLGTLVGLGVLCGAALMVLAFSRAVAWVDPAPGRQLWLDRVVTTRFLSIARTVALLWLVLAGGALLWRGLPPLSHSSSALQPRNSIAYATMERMQEKLSWGNSTAYNMLVTGDTAEEVAQRLRAANTQLSNFQRDGKLEAFLPLQVWPALDHQLANLPEAAEIAGREDDLRQILLDTGFSKKAFTVTDRVLEDWENWARSDIRPIWPEEPASRWLLRRVINRTETEVAAQGLVQTTLAQEDVADLAADLAVPGTFLAGWPLLGEVLTDFATREIALTLGVFTLILLVMLYLAFRDWRDVFAAALVLVLNALSLLGGMALLGLEWNFFNLGATLLLLGTSIDFSIHLLLGLRREGGAVLPMQHRVGNALMLCGVTTIIGFGSISFAQNQGLASLGQVCALGHFGNTLLSVFLLPPLRKALGLMR